MLDVSTYTQLPKENRERLELIARAYSAQTRPLGVEGFRDFYWCIWRREMPPYAEKWVISFASGKWTILSCFRGSTKSVTLPVSFGLYCLGKEPWTSNLIVQANDDTASKTSSLMATIIKHYSGWSACFPNVVPDEDRGWGAKGYFLKDTTIDYGKWLEECSRDHGKDPSFVGAGIGSADIVGMHPHRLFFDDIHDIGNSSYPRERQKIVDTVRANVLPAITKPGGKKPFIGICCTPWDKEDAYHVLFDTGLFEQHVTPILRFDENGDEEFEGSHVFLTWKDGFSIEAIKDLRKVNSKTEFARMYLCDLDAAKNAMYKWYSYPSDHVDMTLPMVAGVDYASVFLPTSAREGGRSHFAMAYITDLPNGCATVVDGVLEQCSQADAETYVMSAQNIYPGWKYVVIESDGSGMEFIQLLQRNPNMKIIPKKTSDVFRGSKEKRQYNVLSPLLERGVLRVSDAVTPFLNCFRSYLENYPNLDKHAPEWDVADAVLWATVGIPTLSSAASLTDEHPILNPRKRNEFILSALGNARR